MSCHFYTTKFSVLWYHLICFEYTVFPRFLHIKGGDVTLHTLKKKLNRVAQRQSK